MQIFTICKPSPMQQKWLRKLFITMKLTTFLMILGCVQLHAAVFSQTINLSERNVSLETVFSKLEKQSGYTFFTKLELIQAMPKVNVSFKNATLTEALDQLLSKLSLSYSIVDKTVVIKPSVTLFENINKVAPVLVIGTITDEKDIPMPGVNIKVKGTDLRVVSDANGKFRILVTGVDVVLQISYIGYVTQEFKVSNIKSPFIIKLKVASSDLDQVQILAYGTTTKRLSTGNTFTIKSEEIEKNPVPNILQVLENRVPGLSVVQNSGQVGGSFTVRVRGMNGFNNIDPLYIVDGVAFPAGGNNYNPNGQPGGLPTLQNNRGRGVAGQLGGNALNYINPNDIESIDVLKDADATSIYGSRGAYGVILITTKRGKAGKPRLSININRALSVTGTFPDLLNTADYLTIRREAFKNDGLTPGASDLDVNGTYPEDAYTNFAKEITGSTASTTRLNASYSGGTDLTSYSVSGTYNDQGNVLRSSGYSRDGGLRFNLGTLTPNKKFGFDLNGSYNSTVNTMTPYDFTGDAAVLRAPNAPSYFNPDGTLNWKVPSNPFGYLNTIYKGVTNNMLANATFNYRPAKGLTIKAVLGFNSLSGDELRALPSTVFDPATAPATINSNMVSASNIYNIRTMSFEPYANYVTKLGHEGTLTVNAGATFQDKLNYQSVITGSGYVADARLNNPAAGTTVSSTFNKYVTRYMGYFSSIGYNWANKYILSLSGRYDGSAKFGPEHRFGTFGSVAGAYIFTEEKWIKETLPFLSFGKLKASYGTSGGDGIPTYLYIATYSTGTAYLGNTVFTTNSIANGDLHWEFNKKRDFGLTLGFFKDRITLDLDYYKNTSSDQLINQPLSSITGATTIAINSAAVIQNTGYEFSLSSNNIENKNFKWSTSAVLTIPNSKLISFPPGLALPSVNYVVGLPLSNVKLYNYIGVDPETGYYNYINAAGVKGAYNVLAGGLGTNDKTENLNVGVKYFGSISNSFSYKQLSLDFTFALQNKVGPNFQGSISYLPGSYNQNLTTWALDRWQNPGDITNVPRATTNLLVNLLAPNNFKQSTGAYERITYARLQNVNISYSLSNSFLKRINLNNLRIFLQGQNLLTISKYGSLDPENLSLTILPPLRVFSLGLNFSL